MKNLIPYSDDCFEIHKRAVNKKHNSELKDRLLLLNPSVQKEYDKFLEKFDINELSLLVPNTTPVTSKADLLTLYSYKSSVMISVRESIRRLQIKTITNTCQNCTLDSANTLDHLLPKASFPEFVVNPKNLFPCCPTCNSYKLDAFEDRANQKFLNLYLDNLPEDQYLFVDVFLDEFNEMNFRFYLENVDAKINTELFSVIENHYEKLHLFERMRLKSIEHISELDTKVQSFKHSLPINQIVIDLISAANIDKLAYGYNHWKCILEITLLNTPLFMNKF